MVGLTKTKYTPMLTPPTTAAATQPGMVYQLNTFSAVEEEAFTSGRPRKR